VSQPAFSQQRLAKLALDGGTGAELAGKLDAETLRVVLRQDAVGPASKLLDQGVTAQQLRILADTRLKVLADLEGPNSAELLKKFAKQLENGYASSDQITEFARNINNLNGVDGVSTGTVKDMINANTAGNVAGALQETRVGVKIGAKNIKKMGVKVGPSGVDGELDIIRKSGDVVEVKKAFGTKERSVYNTFKSKLSAIRKSDQVALDENSLTVRAKNVEDVGMVQNQANAWSNKIANNPGVWGDVEVDIRVFSESKGKVVAETS